MPICESSGCKQQIQKDGFCPLHLFKCEKCNCRVSKANSLCWICQSANRPKFYISKDLYVVEIEKSVDENLKKTH